jgi:sugar lactone lactonase YvrE
MIRPAITVALALLLAACSRHDPRPGSPAGPASAASAASDRGPTRVTVDGDPNGLWWDPATGSLLIADSAKNRILRWTDGGGITTLRDLAPAPDKNAGLGQLVMTRDGKIFVTRFGFGTSGGVAYAAADGTTGSVPGLDPHRRRIGLSVAADGTLYDTWFVKEAGKSTSAVARLDPAGAETDVLTGFEKLVGVLADGDDLLASDQAGGTIVKTGLATPGKAAALAQLPAPDLLCRGPDGSLFTGGTTGEVRQVSREGKVRTLAGGFSQVRGVAYDAKNRRLFASEHSPKGGANALRIVPVD